MSKRQLLAVIASTSLTLCAAPGCGSSDTTAAPAAGTDGATSATAGGGGSVGAGGAAGEGGRGGGVAPAPLVPAEGVSFDQIAIYQGPKRSLLGGPPSPSGVDVPVVAGRDAIVRLFLSAGSTYDGSPVTARLFLGDDPVPMEATAAVRAGDEGDLATTVNLEIPGARIVPGVDYHVELLQPPDHASGAGEGARHPATGATSVGVSSDGPSLKLVLVPIVYGADGSDRMPDTSPAQLDGYRAKFLSTYPLAKLDLTVHEPFPYGGIVHSFGLGWGAILDAVATLRDAEGVPDDVYYFGVFQPADTFDGYCGNGCTTGNGFVGSPDDPYARAAVGLGFAGADFWGTAIHEIGHTQGRSHAPCGDPSDVDPDFPYEQAGTGVFGYDLVTKQLVAPTVGKDLMGYCDPYFVSDYTFRGIFDEMRIVSGAKALVPAKGAPVAWERARVEPDGSLTLLSPVRRASATAGERWKVRVRTGRGEHVGEGRFRPYADAPGGVVLWPAREDRAIGVAR